MVVRNHWQEAAQHDASCRPGLYNLSDFLYSWSLTVLSWLKSWLCHMINVISLSSLLTSLPNCLLGISAWLVVENYSFTGQVRTLIPCLPIVCSHLNTILWICSSFCTSWVTFWFWLPSIPTHILRLSILDTRLYSTPYRSVMFLLTLSFKFVLNFLLSPMSIAI